MPTNERAAEVSFARAVEALPGRCLQHTCTLLLQAQEAAVPACQEVLALEVAHERARSRGGLALHGSSLRNSCQKAALQHTGYTAALVACWRQLTQTCKRNSQSWQVWQPQTSWKSGCEWGARCWPSCSAVL